MRAFVRMRRALYLTAAHGKRLDELEKKCGFGA